MIKYMPHIVYGDMGINCFCILMLFLGGFKGATAV